MSSGLLDQKREEMFGAAERFVAGGKTLELQRALCDAASAYGFERAKHFRANQTQESAELVVPFGRTQGTKISEAETTDLNWLLGVMKERVDRPDLARHREKNVELIAAIERELETR
jgi:hypothetical protein